jgi:hypothetical protein
MAELERIRVMVARTDELLASGHDYILEYLDSLGSYMDTICNDVEWSGDGGGEHPSHGATPRVSPKPSTIR